MEDKNLQFPIPNSVLEPYIKTAVSTAITAALGDGSKLIEQAVNQALSTKVNSQGQVDSRYSSDNKYMLAELVASNKIREIAKEVINQMAEDMRPKIKEEIEKYLKKQHSVFAKTLVDGMIKGLSCSWSVKVTTGE
jgi:uncharacterized membrane-anchored protein YjiN (DUF445 family)